ncbi:MAG: hypothetical protein ACF8MJ_08110 [Phycisphaerales bacterium JB050]
MPRLSTIRLDALSELVAELRYTPREALLRCIERTESLALEIDPETTYPMEWVVFRVTGYRPKDAPDEMIVGGALITDLSALLEHLCDAAELSERELEGDWHSIDALAERWSVSRKSIERYRRQGLVARRFRTERGRTRLGFSPAVVDAFEESRAEQLERAGSFERIGADERAWLYKRALRYKTRLGWRLAKIAERLSARTGRSLATVRRALIRADEAATEPVFRVRRKLADQQARTIARAWDWGIKPGVIGERFGRSRTSVLRIATDEHAAQLRGWRDRIMPEDAPEGAISGEVVEQILSTPGATQIAWEPLALEAKALLARCGEQTPLRADREAEMGAARYLLLIRAARGVDGLAPSMALATAVDAIQTDLRWALALQRMLVRAQLPLVIRTVEERLGCGLMTLRPDQIRRILRLAVRAAADATAGFGPVKPSRSLTGFGRLAAPVSLALNRSLSREVFGVPAGESAGRASTARAELDDWTRELVGWQRLVEFHPGILRVVQDGSPGVDGEERAMVGERFGLTGSPPKTVALVADRFGVTPARVVSATRRVLRAVRAHGGG